MKKIFVFLGILLAVSSSANAQTLKAKAIDEISTACPKSQVRIELIKDINLYGFDLKKGYVLTGTLSDVKSPNKLPVKEASFVFTLIKYKDSNGNEYELTKEIKTVYSKKHIKFIEKFLNETDFSFSPIANANLNVYGNETDITGKTSQNMNNLSIKPLSIAEKLMSEEYKEDLKDDINYKTGLSTDGEDILIFSGDKIKFDFPD